MAKRKKTKEQEQGEGIFTRMFGNRKSKPLIESEDEDQEESQQKWNPSFETRFGKGNRFWENRATHGVDKIFKEPEALREAACEYFGITQDNPLFEIDFRGKELQMISIPKMKPYSLEACCLFLGVNSAYLRQFRAAIKKREEEDKVDPLDPGFSTVISWIEDVIWVQQYEGASSGFFNANIISRRLGLSEKIETKNESVSVDKIQIEIVEATDPDDED